MREEGTSLSQKSLPLRLSLFAYLFEKYKEMESAPVQTRHIKKPRLPIVKVKQRGCMKEALLQCQAGLISSKKSKFWRKATIKYLVGEYPQSSQGITNKKPTC